MNFCKNTHGKNHRAWIRSIIFLLCLGLAFPLDVLAAAPAPQSRKKSSSKKPTRKKRTTTTPAPRRTFDQMMGTEGAVAPGQSVMISTAAGAVDPGSLGSQIDESALRAHIKFLSDDLLEGRGTGARGGLLAAKYIAAQFEALGLEPAAPDRTYYQQVQMIGAKSDPSTKLVIKSEGSNVANEGGGNEGANAAQFAFGDEFVAGTDLEDPSINIISDIVFVGYGVQAPEYNWDDYKGLDVRGKVLLCLVNDPPATEAEPKLFGGRALTYYGRWTYKYEEAARRGAAGVILVHTSESAGYGWSVVRNSWGGERFGLAPEAEAPSLRLKAWVSEEAARRIALMGGHALNDLQRAAASRDFRPVPLQARVDMTLKSSVRRIAAPNVAAVLRGSDPELKNEFIIYSGHWDHLGIRPDQPGDNIYNGAIDNATGIAGIITIAQAFAAMPVKPKRSILFLATTAEEQGLLGAEYYTRHPLVPLAKTAANINLDSMNVLGPTSDISPLGWDRSTLGKIIEAVATENQVTISPDPRPEQGLFYRSDHFPFAKAGVPAVSFNPGTNFVGHSEKWVEEQLRDYQQNRYHQPADEYSPSWDLRGLVQQARLAFLVGLRTANTPEAPQWNPDDEFARARKER
ncbi:MAG: M28 family peptidase [Acidobacteria bacterium]|nr:M28 family peptidase [Acidobacteriota bacterium]